MSIPITSSSAAMSKGKKAKKSRMNDEYVGSVAKGMNRMMRGAAVD